MERPDPLDLPPGLAEKTFIEAVQSSGYPLQIITGAALSERGFDLEEEWAFADPDTEARRSLDIVARRPSPSGPIVSDAATTTLSMVLLIECKQSRHPYVFFESVAPPQLDDFPPISGLGANGTIRVSAPGGKRGSYVPLVRAIGADDGPLIGAPPVAASLSRAEVNGKSVKLSGEDPYNSLLMPLTKALERYRREWRGERKDSLNPQSAFDVRVPLALAVLDAPMIFVGRPSGQPHLENTRWVRLIVRNPVRWHHTSVGTRRSGGDFSVVDVVHRSYLTDFLDRVLAPFAEQLHSAFEELADEILDGKM